jgi:Sortase domain
MSFTRSRRRVAAAAAAALLGGAGTAWATSPQTSANPPLNRPHAPSAQAARAPSDGPDRTLLQTEEPPEASPVSRPDRSPGVAAREVAIPQPPTTLVIARIGVRMAVLPVGVASDGQMALPPDPAEIGWYRYGPRPGERAGATVLAAHIDSAEYGIGPLARLGELRLGDVITVTSGGTSRRYGVGSTRKLTKSSLDLPSIFARTGPPRLHLVTCGGDYDRQKQHYEQNVVVLASPVG